MRVLPVCLVAAAALLATTYPAEDSRCLTLAEAREAGKGWPRWTRLDGRRCWYVSRRQLRDLRASRPRHKVGSPDPEPQAPPEPVRQPVREDVATVQPAGEPPRAGPQRAQEDRLAEADPPRWRPAETSGSTGPAPLPRGADPQLAPRSADPRRTAAKILALFGMAAASLMLASVVATAVDRVGRIRRRKAIRDRNAVWLKQTGGRR